MATIVDSGDGLVVTVFGGDHPHVGATVVATPRPSLSDPGKLSTTSTVVPLLGHKDDVLARPVAEALAARLGVPVVVVAGLHVENASGADLAAVDSIVHELVERLLRSHH